MTPMAQTRPQLRDIASRPGPTVQVSGRHMDVGEALRTRIEEGLAGVVGKYFGGGGGAEVRLHKDGFSICCDMVVTLASGQQLVVKALGADAHGAFDGALVKLDKRIRRYKRLLTNHHGRPRATPEPESAPLVVLRSGDNEDADLEAWEADGAAAAPAAMIVAETTAPVRTLTVSMAVMELDLTDAPVLLFRNAGHGGLSVVYRRGDGNIGWIDPERTRASASTSDGRASTPVPQAPSPPAAVARSGTKV